MKKNNLETVIKLLNEQDVIKTKLYEETKKFNEFFWSHDYSVYFFLYQLLQSTSRTKYKYSVEELVDILEEHPSIEIVSAPDNKSISLRLKTLSGIETGYFNKDQLNLLNSPKWLKANTDFISSKIVTKKERIQMWKEEIASYQDRLEREEKELENLINWKNELA